MADLRWFLSQIIALILGFRLNERPPSQHPRLGICFLIDECECEQADDGLFGPFGDWPSLGDCGLDDGDVSWAWCRFA